MALKAFIHCGRDPDSLISVHYRGWPDHPQSRVWLLQTADGPRYLKVLGKRKFRQAHRFYTQWQPQLADCTPELLSASPAEGVLLLSVAPGEPSSIEAELAPELYRQAGAFLARLHRLPFTDEDSIGFAQALELRSSRLFQSLEKSRLQLGALQEALNSCFVHLQGQSRVLCHGDFQPRNWLVGPDSVYYIDFEHCKGDHFLTDFATHWNQMELESREQFLLGYGRKLNEAELKTLEVLSALHILGTLAWAREKNHQEFFQQSRAAWQDTPFA